jgi:hypothetical protein
VSSPLLSLLNDPADARKVLHISVANKKLGSFQSFRMPKQGIAKLGAQIVEVA